MKQRLINLQEILVLFLPLALLTGNFFPDLIVVILGVSFLACVNFKNENKYFKNYFFISFSFFWIAMVISSLLSEMPSFSIQSSLPYIRFLFFSLSIWYLIDNKENFIKNFTIILICTFIIVIADGYIQYFSGSSIFGYDYERDRLTVLISGNKSIGTYLSRLYPLLIAVALLIYSKNTKVVFLLAVIFILIDVLIFLTGERVAFFNLMLSTIIFILLINRWKKIRLFSFLFSIALIFSILIIDTDVKKRMIDHTIKQTNIAGEGGEKIYLFSGEHQNYYTTSIKMFLDNPILGIGPKMYRHVCKEERYFSWTKHYPIVNSCSTHPHGTFFQLLAEVGIVGIFPYLLAFFSIVYIFIKRFFEVLSKKQSTLSDYETCLMIAVVISLWPLIPTMQFFHNWISIIYFFPIGFLLSYQNRDLIKKEDSYD